MFDYEFIKEVRQLKRNVSKIFIYGAGFRGLSILKILRDNKIHIDGFCVTKLNGVTEKDGLPIFQAESVWEDSEVGFILGLSDADAADVMKYLKGHKISLDKIVDGGKYISEYRGTVDLGSKPFLEITTVVGCRVNCRFCPQDVLIQEYFKNDKNRKHIMKPEDFQTILAHVPKECIIMFAGMAEPFLNSHCTELLKMACDSGRAVRLYTTLEGANEKDIDEILGLPLQFVGLHIADRMGYAQIETSEKYYKFVERLLNARKVNDGRSFLDDITSQSVPDERIEKLCEGKFEIITAVCDRAGNLKSKESTKREIKLVNEKFICRYCGPQMNNHVVLPDGTLLLCQNDYGMKHVLGNLLENTYDGIRGEKPMREIFAAMQGKRIGEVLCDTCLHAKIVD